MELTPQQQEHWEQVLRDAEAQRWRALIMLGYVAVEESK